VPIEQSAQRRQCVLCSWSTVIVFDVVQKADNFGPLNLIDWPRSKTAENVAPENPLALINGA
jgi:hypothetical protein